MTTTRPRHFPARELALLEQFRPRSGYNAFQLAAVVERLGWSRDLVRSWIHYCKGRGWIRPIDRLPGWYRLTKAGEKRVDWLANHSAGYYNADS